MKKFLHFLTAGILLFTVLAWAPAVYAEGGTANAVVIGDGAPIPYLDGFQSRLVESAGSISGITGALPDLEVSEVTDSGTWVYELENLVLTDDVLGLFFKQTYSEPISYEGDSQFAYSFATSMPNILVNGENLDLLNQFCEGHAIDACSQYSFVLYSLSQPINDGQTLTFGAEWKNDRQAREGGATLIVDRSRAKDPTVAYQPCVNVKKSLSLWEGDTPVAYDFTIERVAYTPFGNRMVIAFNGTCERNQYLDYQLLDEDGHALNIVPPLLRYQTNASVEHPVSNDNEVWFFGGEDSRSLTLVPLGGNWEDGPNANRVASVPLDTLPADVRLENGVTLHVESCDFTAGGFYALYSTDGYAGYVSLDLGDADGNALGLIFTSYTLDNPIRGLLGYGGYWSEEYKGKAVPRVTQEQLSQIKTLLVDYTVSYPSLIENESIPVTLTK